MFPRGGLAQVSLDFTAATVVIRAFGDATLVRQHRSTTGDTEIYFSIEEEVIEKNELKG